MKKTFVTLFVAACMVLSVNAQKGKSTSAQVKPIKLKLNVEQTTASGLKIKLIQEGKGKQAAAGSTVAVHYTGTLTDGKKFDSSRDRGEPIKFKLGEGRVIKGWDEGVALMKEGEEYTFVIPWKLAYGERGAGPIPPFSSLVFDVKLVKIN